ncbi:hypothetical protein B0H13DRAFT_1885615 [Mycena leptocephala]|nr:hypothetical protein B0H13DRAFT_1885615 [Mycena leptocephala]
MGYQFGRGEFVLRANGCEEEFEGKDRLKTMSRSQWPENHEKNVHHRHHNFKELVMAIANGKVMHVSSVLGAPCGTTVQSMSCRRVGPDLLKYQPSSGSRRPERRCVTKLRGNKVVKPLISMTDIPTVKDIKQNIHAFPEHGVPRIVHQIIVLDALRPEKRGRYDDRTKIVVENRLKEGGAASGRGKDRSALVANHLIFWLRLFPTLSLQKFQLTFRKALMKFQRSTASLESSTISPSIHKARVQGNLFRSARYFW